MLEPTDLMTKLHRSLEELGTTNFIMSFPDSHLNRKIKKKEVKLILKE